MIIRLGLSLDANTTGRHTLRVETVAPFGSLMNFYRAISLHILSLITPTVANLESQLPTRLPYIVNAVR
uniref:Uncharacterized protein n=1 Tax=Bursaphelenchus xylophilus TaxID=6326 RepID=A0A1I7S7A0_BURXY